ncbi:hypothetical protein [Paucibacter sp. Y2R2-4]|uniref:hypothetical protein n=1 Tax=Paucibacter sp. Y2R2-4 TaxID=2893553 RepID=UPI0021E4FE55|nr:hypothetical protein [Paucibacter sp. Y2R2-4]MCV2349333.1 hypothetical protein [Paucibacter sp. Y2R2-4]
MPAPPLAQPLAAVQRVYRARAEGLRRLQAELEALLDLKARLVAGDDAGTMLDQILALFADLGDAQAVADYCAERGWQALHDDGQQHPFSAEDVKRVVEWDELPGCGVLRTLAQARLMN